MDKKLSEITRKEWIVFQWIDTQEFGEERHFMRGHERTPGEAMQAAEEWDFLQEVKSEGEKNEAGQSDT